uniref:Uncharacterized protein n=1 Tax=Oryza glumipatula TaxID=40148 RepID=A0A0E0BCN5_9ORYZ
MHLTLSPGRTARTKAAHARTASHHHHPALARLDGGVRELMSWTVTSRSGGEGSSGLALVEAVLAALGEVLQLPMAVAALHGGEAAAAARDRVLDDGFLVLADAYGTFESALLALRESVAGARRDWEEKQGVKGIRETQSRGLEEKSRGGRRGHSHQRKRPATVPENDTTFEHSYVDTLLDLRLPEDGDRALTDKAMNPSIQAKLYDEIKVTVGDDHEGVSEEDTQKMPYLKAVILEGLRKHPPATSRCRTRRRRTWTSAGTSSPRAPR